MALANLYICTGSNVPSLCHTAISTKTKCADLFDLCFTLNQTKLGMLKTPAGKGLTSWLSFVVSNCEFVTFSLVSWVRCGT